MNLYKQGAYLLNGQEVVLDEADALAAVAAKTGKSVSKEEAKENTKNALSKHPVIKGLVKGIYFGIKKIGETGIQGTGLR